MVQTDIDGWTQPYSNGGRRNLNQTLKINTTPPTPDTYHHHRPQGWDALSARLDEHLNALGAMRLSPYFSAAQEFAEEAGLWEDRLGRVKAALELWMVVQKR